MKRLLVTLSVLGAAGITLVVSAALAVTAGSAGHSRSDARASASARSTAAAMCPSECQSDKRELATPELPPHPQVNATGQPIVEVMPAPNADTLSVGASVPFTIYLACPAPGFLLNGSNWMTRSPVQSMVGQGTNGYWFGTLQLNSSSSATFRDSAGDVLGFVPGPGSIC